MHDDSAAALSRLPLFCGLSPPQVAMLAAAGARRSIAAGEVVFHEGAASDGLHVVLEGKLRILRQVDPNMVVDVALVGPGEAYGEIALLDGGPRSATVVALEPSELLVLDRDVFLRQLSEAPSLMGAMLGQLTRSIRNSTERLVRGELEQRALRAEMEVEKYRALTEMVAGVAHEINTPLGTVNTASSVVRHRLDSQELHTFAASNPAARELVDDMREALLLIERNIQRAHRLVETFKKLSVSQTVDVLETFNVLDLVNDTVALFRLEARQAHLELRVQSAWSDSAAATCTGYPGHLTQILLNLFTNAERYAYPHDEGGRIDISPGDHVGASDPPSFEITVRDYGRGMTADVRARAFEPFFTTGRALGGTGLGLAIVRNLVTESLKGTISIWSETGQGTAVTVIFPKSLQ
ncbi:MAG: cyclic nucleotide-binding domain-containing protein [Chloroflexi bacterium]|nr:cyclic nucleotide-binding domain-containing protein [Chloroflexota bacterium]